MAHLIFKESVSIDIKQNDIVIFEINTTIDIYKVLNVEMSEIESINLWNDNGFPRIIRLEYIKTIQVICKIY